MSTDRANTPIRPQLLTEQIVEADESTEDGGVQAELKEIDELRARVDKLSREHADRDSGKVPMVSSPNDPTAEEVERHEHTARPVSHSVIGICERAHKESRGTLNEWQMMMPTFLIAKQTQRERPSSASIISSFKI